MFRKAAEYTGGGAVLLSRLNHAWRLAMTGVAFIGLWLGGFVLAIVIVPLATVFKRDPIARGRIARSIIHVSFRFYLAALRAAGLIVLDVTGKDKLEASHGIIVVANHPTLLDVVLIMSLIPDAQCVVKHELWNSILLRPLIRAAGYIRNDSDPEIMVENCRRALAEGSNLIIFPEGTRSIPGKPHRFQRGFAHIATLTGVDLQPIIIHCKPATLVKGQRWYKIPETPPRFVVEVYPRIQTQPFLQSGSRARAARRLVSHLESFYEWGLQRG